MSTSWVLPSCFGDNGPRQLEDIPDLRLPRGVPPRWVGVHHHIGAHAQSDAIPRPDNRPGCTIHHQNTRSLCPKRSLLDLHMDWCLPCPWTSAQVNVWPWPAAQIKSSDTMPAVRERVPCNIMGMNVIHGSEQLSYLGSMRTLILIGFGLLLSFSTTSQTSINWEDAIAVAPSEYGYINLRMVLNSDGSPVILHGKSEQRAACIAPDGTGSTLMPR